MANYTTYYCVDLHSNKSDPGELLAKFIKEGIWESGGDKRYLKVIKEVKIGSMIAARTTLIETRDGQEIKLSKIWNIGTVVENYEDGTRLGIKWKKKFKAIEVEQRSIVRSPIGKLNNIYAIRAIFGDVDLGIKEGEIPIYTKSTGRNDNKLYPCFKLTKIEWDDFGYHTLYNVYYHEDDGSSVNIGRAKFYDKETDSGELPEMFSMLDDNYCSLGLDNSYYEKLREKLDKVASDYYVEAVNDLAINRGIRIDFERTLAFRQSLLRGSDAQKSYKEGYYIYNGIVRKESFDFEFSTTIGKALKPHKIHFKFTEDDVLPFRIKVLIGKNGTGKTHYLSKLASTLSGLAEEGTFNSEFAPSFSRVITISYSLFDRFPRPENTKGFSYYYCGFRGGRGFLTPNQMNTRFLKAIKILQESRQMIYFAKCLSDVLSGDIADELLDEEFEDLRKESFKLFDSNNYSKYSSGQLIMILVLAELIAYITEDSLVLIDEPETHLHPNSISLFINVINKILSKYESYAIIATHSPQIVQEVPAKDIVVLERNDKMASTREVGLETFGENLNTITQRIFYTINNDEYYRIYLTRLAKKMDYDSIITAFEEKSQPLGLNAKMYLQSLYEEPNTAK
ncbi:AAA family ATPase [Sphingobacterium siyangense]|uniref:AAA family ATPase n=1 Tax=Sphingobacterium siyangense TaxID=459529 RepID=UPI001965629E|nr:AAA family ATPase [Sphingobacterium siyangense]QRY55961.1 AAA family ATPase [Sphingobacterium siyangense]